MKVNKRKIIIIVIFLIVSVVIIEYKTNIIPKAVVKIKTYIDTKKEYEFRNKVDEKLKKELESYQPLSHEENAWYSNYKFIAHAGGAIDGKLYTNSKEAFEQSYSNGNRVFDADLTFTSDGVLVLKHSWLDDLEQENISSRITNYWIDDYGHIQISKSETPSYEEFQNTLIFHKYESMSFLDLLHFMKSHKDIYVACDAKEDVTEVYTYIVNIAKENNFEDLLNRIIVSFYKFEDYDKIKEIYPFENYVIRQQKGDGQFKNYYELAKFCLDNQIPVVNIYTGYIDNDDISVLLDNNIKIYAATVDSIGEMKKYINKGITGAITNYLYESDINYIK